MDIKMDYSDNTTIIYIYGRLDITNSHKLKEAFKNIDESTYNTVILDFSNLEIIDSSGIGKILVFYKKIKDNNANLIIRKPNQYIREIFELTQLDKIIKIES